ncbi:MAG TPA: nuclear transport factor 2 family protein [Solirubrobacterales bacterium]
MSSNLDLISGIFAEWERGDWNSADWADPEIDFVMHGGLNSGEWKGIREMTETWVGTLRAWDDLRAIPEEFRELDDGRILVFLRNEGRGKGSGIDVGEISAKSANVFTVRDGQVIRLELYWERDDAVADLGLTESS